MEITANAVQTVATNSNILFTEVPVKANGSITHRVGSGLISLRGNTCQCRARYQLTFSGNIAVAEDGTVGPISVAISLDGEPVSSTLMTVTPAAIGDYFNVSASIFIDVPKGCCLTASVRNTSATAIDVRNANLIAVRVA